MSHPIFAMTFLSECDYFSLVSNWWLLQEFENIRNVLKQLVEKSIVSFSSRYIIHTYELQTTFGYFNKKH